MDPKCIKWLYVYGDDIYGLPIASNCSITLSSTSATSIPYRIPGKSILSQLISTTPTPTPTPTHPAFPHWKHHILFLISNPDLCNSCQIISNKCNNSMSYLPHSISSAKISVRIVTPISISQHTLYHCLFRPPDINHNQEGGKKQPSLNPLLLPILLHWIPPNRKLPSFSSYSLWINLSTLPPYPTSLIWSQSTSLVTLLYAFIITRTAQLYPFVSLIPTSRISPSI